MSPPTGVPLLLLDVDGVLNALGRPPRGWPEYRTTRAVADGTVWPIAWAPAVVERLNGLAREGRAEVQWLTTWVDDAPADLAPRLGLDDFAVAGRHEDADGYAWWKEGVARAVPDGRALVWLDDDLAVEGGARAWAQARPRTLAIAPDPLVGLSPDDLEQVERFLADPDAAEAVGDAGARRDPGSERAADPRYDVGPRRG